MPIFSIIFLLLLTVPVLEIFLLIKVGAEIGVWNTIFFVFATAFLGAYLLRKQGLSTIARAQSALGRHEMPATEMLEGVILVFTGTLLLTPGFFTDTVGFLCLIPQVRKFLAERLISRFAVISAGGAAPKNQKPGNPRKEEQQIKEPDNPKTIDGEFWREDD